MTSKTIKAPFYTLLFVFSGTLFAEPQQARALIEATERTVISSEIGGNILEISKQNGDYFDQGEVLVKIECDVYEAQKEKIQTKRDLIALRVDKNKQLAKYNSVGKFDIETSQLELKEQEVELHIADINVKRCEIKAPFTGRVAEKFVHRYQNVKPQDQLLEIVNTEELEAKVVVPATWINYLRVGDAFVVHIDELDQTIEAKVAQLDSVVDPKSQTMSLRASIEKNPKVIPGMSGTALFKLSQQEETNDTKNQ
jgi:RND family efflux transporter MFP subunit